MEARKKLRIVNGQGLHARPCSSIVATALRYQSELRIRAGEREVNGKSILELMTLGAGEGEELEVRAWGRDAEDLIGALEQLFQGGFGELG
jgi:phosphotransferase system HPr (HPr) family protein